MYNKIIEELEAEKIQADNDIVLAGLPVETALMITGYKAAIDKAIQIVREHAEGQDKRYKKDLSYHSWDNYETPQPPVSKEKSKINEIAELKKELERRTELLKEMFYQHYEPSDQVEQYWQQYSKEHNLQPIDKPTQEG